MGFISYFTALFNFDSAGDTGPCLQHLDRKVSEDMNEELLKPFSAEEIQTALFQMAPSKCLGPMDLQQGLPI